MPHISAEHAARGGTSARARPARARPGVSGCSRAKPGQARRPLVDLRVVLHRARPERIELRVDAEVPLREAHEVAERLGLAHLGQAGAARCARARRRAPSGRPSGTSSGGERRAGAARRAALEDRRLAELDALRLGSCHGRSDQFGAGSAGRFGLALFLVLAVPVAAAESVDRRCRRSSRGRASRCAA